jgi:regulator of sigma E protease
MKGERSYIDALENDKASIDPEPGSFYGATPWRRIVTLLAGPVANIVFAVVVLSIIFWFGFEETTYQNRIVLASDYTSAAEPSAADVAGLETGDIITSINGEQVASWLDVQQIVARNALTELTIEVVRDGRNLEVTATPALSPDGAGVLGVYPWVDPIVSMVEPGSAAADAGFREGDRILTVDGQPIAHVWDFRDALPTDAEPASFEVVRDGSTITLTATTSLESLAAGLGFAQITISTPDYSVPGAIARGARESFELLTESIRSLRLLVSGIRLRNAVAGPVRISVFIGEVATSGFSIGFFTGIRSLFRFLSFLSVVLFFMNLLPIPVLDGGQILAALFEWIRGRSPRPRSLYRYQLVGSVLVFAILFFALFGDILFIAGR